MLRQISPVTLSLNQNFDGNVEFNNEQILCYDCSGHNSGEEIFSLYFFATEYLPFFKTDVVYLIRFDIFV